MQATNVTNAVHSSNSSAGSSHGYEVLLSSDFDFLRRCPGPSGRRGAFRSLHLRLRREYPGLRLSMAALTRRFGLRTWPLQAAKRAKLAPAPAGCSHLTSD